ncbi:hypothetical protein MAUB1S_08436 [Mycolicibacterium aubagnense]
MAYDNPAPAPEKPGIREFDAETWVGEPDTRTYQEFQDARGKVVLAIILAVGGAVAFLVVVALIARLTLFVLL